MNAGSSENFRNISLISSSPVLFIVLVLYPPIASVLVTADRSASSYSISIFVPVEGLACISSPSSVHTVRASAIGCDVVFSLTTRVSVIIL